MDDAQFEKLEASLLSVLESLKSAFETITEPNGGLQDIKNAVNTLKEIQSSLISIYYEDNINKSVEDNNADEL